jgi:hypothetical protein
MEALEQFTTAYVEAALWSSNDESDESGGEPMDANYTADNIHPVSAARMERDCIRFVRDNAADLEEFYELVGDGDECTAEERAGHDFWLTRNGHGAGFWARDAGDVGERLTQACKECGEYHLYVGDDGYIHGAADKPEPAPPGRTLLGDLIDAGNTPHDAAAML